MAGNAAPVQQTGVQTRTITYGYDGLNRLTSAAESGATTNTYSYSYDKAGNRLDGGRAYDAANQVVGWTYDTAGNLLSDGTTSYSYDALNRAVTTGGTTNQYNADGVLVQQGTTRYVQDLASPLSQILGDGTSTYIYGQERLFAQASGARLWYATDALGSVRQTLSDSGAVLGSIAYDPWGQVQSGNTPTFGFTGELQQGSNVYLRARWYNATNGTFTSKDPFVGMPEQPYSLMPYQYAYSAPTTWTDASGQAVSDGGGGAGPCPAGQARFGTRCRPGGAGGGSGGGSWTAPPAQGSGVVIMPPPMTGPVVEPPLFPAGGMPFEVPAVPLVGPVVGPVIFLGPEHLEDIRRFEESYKQFQQECDARRKLALAARSQQRVQQNDPNATATKDQRRPAMIVQLQEQRGPGSKNTKHWDTERLFDLSGDGVLVTDALSALDAVRTHPAIPTNRKIQNQADDALRRAKIWVNTRPSLGVSEQNRSWSFYFDPQNPSFTWRIDIVNITGTNLKK